MTSGEGRLRCWGGLLAAVAVLPACLAEPNDRLMYWMRTGQYERALDYTREHQSAKLSDRDYLLDRMRLGLAAMAAQDEQTADRAWERVYEVLRMQGLNADKTVTSVLVNEDLKLWKGEPFEQAMAFFYVAAHYASLGSWDNARAAAGNALFYLRDFDGGAAGGPLDSEQLIRRTQEQGDEYLDHGYVPTPSDFALGHLMAALANVQLGRPQEAEDHVRAVVGISPRLKRLGDLVLSGRYNVVLAVDYGLGPQKVGTGPDGAIADYVPLTPSNNQPLWIEVGGARLEFQPVADLNQMAAGLKWRNLEDVRVAKSLIGDLLVGAGAAAAVLGAGAHSEEAVIGGLGGLAAGAIAKAGAHADTRYLEILPQRVYLAPIQVEPGQSVRLQIPGLPRTGVVLNDLAPAGEKTCLRYVRLPPPRRPAPPPSEPALKGIQTVAKPALDEVDEP